MKKFTFFFSCLLLGAVWADRTANQEWVRRNFVEKTELEGYATTTDVARIAQRTNVWNGAAVKADAAIQSNAFASLPPFDFSTLAGMYLAMSNIVTTLGGSVTNFPALPEK